MSEYRRYQVAGGIYFFTQVTAHRRTILTSESSRSHLRDAFQLIQQRRPFEIVAIVLLPDHLHTLWQLPTGDDDFPTRWRQIKSMFTHRYLTSNPNEAPTSPSRRRRGERGVWQRRYYEHMCRDELDIKRCMDYLHYNPVKHGLAERVRDWPWSSFHRYVRLGEYDRDWGSVEPVCSDDLGFGE